jgi:hypothetical protein
MLASLGRVTGTTRRGRTGTSRSAAWLPIVPVDDDDDLRVCFSSLEHQWRTELPGVQQQQLAPAATFVFFVVVLLPPSAIVH